MQSDTSFYVAIISPMEIATDIVPARGFEPRSEDPKSSVLPLDDAGKETGGYHGGFALALQEVSKLAAAFFFCPAMSMFLSISLLCRNPVAIQERIV